MALIFELEYFKRKLATCKDASDVRVVYSVVVDQVRHMEQAIAEMRSALEAKEAALADVKLDEYKAAMIARLGELVS